MAYRKIKGTKIFDGYRLLDKVVLIVNEQGAVEDLVPLNRAGEDVEEYKGIITPGLINCHCHVELSHLKGVIPPNTGLVPFLISVVKKREQVTIDKQKSIADAEAEMWNNGIVAVADICNTGDAIAVKKRSRMQWYSLVEVLNFYDAGLQKALENYETVLHHHQEAGLTGTLTPHAPYTISTNTFEAINDLTADKIISVHNQETGAEDELFEKGSGDFIKLFNEFGNGTSPFAVSGRSSLQTWLPYFTNGQTILLVHNTFIGEEDILFAKSHAEKWGLNIVYCLCPNANLYIENRLPPIDLLLKHHCSIVLGTDSYSSNWQLNIMSEVGTLRKHFPHIPLETILGWATSNGATAIQQTGLGSFEKGRKPGVVVINETDFSVQRLI